MDKINPTYRKQIESIKVDGETQANEDMKPVYSEQVKALNALHTFVAALYIKYAKDGMLNMNASQKLNAGVKEYLKKMGKGLGESEVKKVTSILGETYSDDYYKNAFVLDSGLKVDLKFNILSQKSIDAAVNTKFKDEMFSSRIWDNKASLVDKIQSDLIEAMKGNKTIDGICKDIKDTFNVGAYNSQRLVNTEVSRVQSQANDDIATDTGVDQQLFSATLEDSTCDECQSLDGNIYNIDDPDKPEIPIHPLCKCTFVNIPYNGWKPTQRRDNSTGENIVYTNYADWAKDKGVD